MLHHGQVLPSLATAGGGAPDVFCKKKRSWGSANDGLPSTLPPKVYLATAKSNAMYPAGLLRAFAFLSLLLALAAAAKTHYDALGIEKSATLQDIKKAYRKLAVQHHPDRNPGNEEAATVKFREISEAYEVLSDKDSRRNYDHMLKHGGTGMGGDFGGFQRQRGGRDPFEQFHSVFENDPFFADAFKGMDDLFEKTFAGGGGGGGRKRKKR